jgi:DNA repair protein RadC
MAARARIKDLPKLDRPREKLFAKGVTALSDIELLAILIGKGTKGKSALELAAIILREANGRMDRLHLDTLQAIRGVGQAKAGQIFAAFELGRRHLVTEHAAIREAKDVLPFVQHIRDKKQEYFVCVSLNGAHEVIESRVVTVGLLDSSQVHPREVFADPLTDRAAAVILAHNHPSGNLEPSSEDLALTERLVRAGDLLGIKVLDHLVLSKRGYCSLKRDGSLS